MLEYSSSCMKRLKTSTLFSTLMFKWNLWNLLIFNTILLIASGRIDLLEKYFREILINTWIKNLPSPIPPSHHQHHHPLKVYGWNAFDRFSCFARLRPPKNYVIHFENFIHYESPISTIWQWICTLSKQQKIKWVWKDDVKNKFFPLKKHKSFPPLCTTYKLNLVSLRSFSLLTHSPDEIIWKRLYLSVTFCTHSERIIDS